jgi:hypothetical protein
MGASGSEDDELGLAPMKTLTACDHDDNLAPLLYLLAELPVNQEIRITVPDSRLVS